MKYTNSFYEDLISECTRDFLESTKLHYSDALDYAIHVNNIMNSPYYMNEIRNHTVEMGNLETIKLSDIDVGLNDDLKSFYSINKKRQSIREYDGSPMMLKEISLLLKTSLFISQNKSQSKAGINHKNIASPGGLFPVELYYLNLKDDYLKLGSYYYDEKNESLKLIPNNSKDYIQDVYRAFAVEEKMDIDIKQSCGIIVLGSTLNRLSFKYLDRGIRWAFTEAGAITHSIQLSATAIGNIGVCPCAGFFDDFVSELIGYKTPDKMPIVSLVVGKV